MTPVTLAIIALSTIVSIACFQYPAYFDKLILHPYTIKRKPLEAYRIITSGLIHANWSHLLFNMLTLYFFGPFMENILGPVSFALLYFLALIASDISTLWKYRDAYAYRSLGASGAIAAVLFAFIYLNPWEKLYLFFALPIPAIVFAVAYLVYSVYMGKRGMDHINHDAHFYGAVFGLLFMLVIDPTHGQLFWYNLSHFG